MDDLAHHPRKRKQDQDDVQDSLTDQSLAPKDASSSSAANVNAPRRQWLTTSAEKPIWNSLAPPTPTSPTSQSPIIPPPDEARAPTVQSRTSPKRPRISTPGSPLKHYCYPSPSSPVSISSDTDDTGSVTPADLGSSSRSPSSRAPKTTYPIKKPTTMANAPPRAALPVVALTNPPLSSKPIHLPPDQPSINRASLRELELDVILRNPMIRHDLLFDSGLLLRPRPKREQSEKYWAAVWEEVQTGCTCATVDEEGRECPKQCVCANYRAPETSMVVVALEGNTRTFRFPSRLPALLKEFLEVMVFVIQPLNNTAVYTNPNAIQAQAQQHAAHAAYLRSVFDPQLIEQQLRHGIFDAAVLFTRIGQTLKQHCAPMRDRAVEEVIRQSQQPGPVALKAFRMGLELLELMKLDIANHQLTQLRPWLLRNTGLFEAKAFRVRFGPDASLHITRQWLSSAHQSLSEPRFGVIVHPELPRPLEYQTMSLNQRIYMCVLRGLAELVFDKDFLKNAALNVAPVTAAGTAAASPAVDSPISPIPIQTPPRTTHFRVHRATRSYICTLPVNVTVKPLASVPESLYLDKMRLSSSATDAVDATVLYMFTLLFRQLVLHNDSRIKIEESDIELLRKDLRAIGPVSLATIFVGPTMGEGEWKSEEEYMKRKSMKQDLVLQVVSHACRVRQRRSPSAPMFPNTSRPVSLSVDTSILAVAERWADDNICPGSQLSQLLHNRVRDVVFAELVGLAWPTSNPITPASTPIEGASPSFMTAVSPTSQFVFGAALSPSATPANLGTLASSAGLGALSVEIKHMSEALARIASFHLNAYLPMYESSGFFSP